MKFTKLEARYITPKLKGVFSLGDVEGLPREIGPERHLIALRGTTESGVEAWGSIDTSRLPLYSEESTLESWALLQALGQQFVGKDFESAEEAVRSLGYLVRHNIFKAGFANLFMDAQALEMGIPLSSHLGGDKDKVEVGISIPKSATIEQISERITRDNFRRIKVKISPTQADYEKIATIKKAFPDVMLMVDANSSFVLQNESHFELLMKYGELGLLMIEQPLGSDDVRQHITLQEEYRKKNLPGKICLDESIHTMDDLVWAIEGGIPIINIKIVRVGGLHQAKLMIDYCLDNGVDAWVGGMMEPTLSKAQSLAMAAHPGVTLPSDISGTEAYYQDKQDPSVEPMTREGAHIKIPNQPGRGWKLDVDVLNSITREVVVFEHKETRKPIEDLNLVYAREAVAQQDELALIPIEECGEKMVSMTEAFEAAGIQASFSDRPFHEACGEWAGKPRIFWARETLVDKLLKIGKKLNELGLRMHFEDGFRPLGVQEGLFLRRIGLTLDAHPEWTTDRQTLDANFDKVLEEAKSKTATTPGFAGHKGGAATDITIIDIESGLPLDIGNNYPEGGAKVAMKYPHITDEQRKNRELFASIMQSEGLSIYPYENWHVSFGDISGAFGDDYEIKDNYSAQYGPIRSFDEETGQISPYDPEEYYQPFYSRDELIKMFSDSLLGQSE